MATGTGPCRSAPADRSSDELGENDLRVVFKALHSVAEKYKFLGLEMNVRMNEIKKIQSQCSDPGECLLEVLSVRLKQIPSLTWRDVDTALRSDTVGEPQLADRIRRQYRHLYSLDLSFEASLDQRQGRKMSERAKRKKRAKKEKFAKKYTQQDSDEEVSESERFRISSEKLNVNEEVIKKTQQKLKKSPHKERHSMPEKEYIEKEIKHEGRTRKNKATKYDKERKVVCGSQHRHKVKHSEQSDQEEQMESESESPATSSEQQIQINNSDSTEESYSSEQESDSAEEVSEKERYQKPSEQPRDDEYPHSHRETPVRKTKGRRGQSSDLEKTKFEIQSKPEGKAKREKKAADQSVSTASQHETADDPHNKCERVAREHKQKKSEKNSKKGVQKAPRENESESSAMRREEERVSSSYHRGKSRKPISAKDIHLQQKQSQGKKLEYPTKPTAKKNVDKKGKRLYPVAKEQSSHEEVREKPAPKSLQQKQEQTKSESEDESSSASTNDDQSELLYESTMMKKHHKMHPNIDGNEIEEERAVRMKKKMKVTKQKNSHGSDSDMREQRKEGKTSTKVNQKTKKTSKEKYLKADTSPRKERKERAEKERILSKKKVIEQDTSSSESTQEDSGDKESDSDDSSEDEEDRDSEKKSQVEEEETEPDDESSPDTSEEEDVKRKPVVPCTKKETGGRKGKRGKIAADLPGNEDPGGRDKEEHDIQPKKRSRRRHRESSMSPTARGGSSPSTLEEENQNKGESKKKTDPIRQKRIKEQGVDIKQEKIRRKEEEDIPSSSDTDDSSPECDMRSLTEEECKKLKKVFKCFFGKLCCAIVNPVETAAQLQKKRLISQSMMKDLIISPESQQSKTISLVGLISKKIGAHPDRLFLFIDNILLDYDAPQLQRVGRDMLTEAGNLTLISTVKLL